ncbi:hypothetical protein [Pseudoroseicyclus aestuarii]|uniref:Uncharacterized protein n=1 Tax=Pseudoroseicyclus aestuarii TaxID=1795041 RepID=A0A318SSW3_9RHOB|nr:hypothetical protein [Pseudoroseicyclus aestuarii]PYE82382.1 hypothetical protein DFP88_104138 [Pseudoroseicyclus aestuarii]
MYPLRKGAGASPGRPSPVRSLFGTLPLGLGYAGQSGLPAPGWPPLPLALPEDLHPLGDSTPHAGKPRGAGRLAGLGFALQRALSLARRPSPAAP